MSHVAFVRARLMAPQPSFVASIPWAILAAAVPTVIRLAVNPLVTDATFPTFYPFILAAAVLVGWRSATLATLLSALAANYFFMTPVNAFAMTGPAIGGGFLFAVSAIAMIGAVEWVRSALPDAGVRPAAKSRAVARPMPIGVPLAIAMVVSLGMWAAIVWGVLKLIG